MIRFQYHSSLALISHLRFKFLPVLQLGKETPDNVVFDFVWTSKGDAFGKHRWNHRYILYLG